MAIDDKSEKYRILDKEKKLIENISINRLLSQLNQVQVKSQELNLECIYWTLLGCFPLSQ